MQANSPEETSHSINAWSRIYSSGEKRRDVYPDQNFIRALYYMFKEHWTSGKDTKVLDIGFGKAYILAYLGQLGFELHGTEVSKESIDIGNQTLSAMDLKADLRLTGDKLEYPENYFDFVVCWETLHFFGNPDSVRKILGEINRVLKPGAGLLSSLIMPNNTQIECSRKIDENVFEVTDEWKYDSRVGSRIFCIPKKEDLKLFIEEIFTDAQIGSFGSEFPNGWGNWHYAFGCNKKLT